MSRQRQLVQFPSASLQALKHRTGIYTVSIGASLEEVGKIAQIIPIHQGKYPILGDFVPIILMDRPYIRRKYHPHILDSKSLGGGM